MVQNISILLLNLFTFNLFLLFLRLQFNYIYHFPIPFLHTHLYSPPFPYLRSLFHWLLLYMYIYTYVHIYKYLSTISSVCIMFLGCMFSGMSIQHYVTNGYAFPKEIVFSDSLHFLVSCRSSFSPLCNGTLALSSAPWLFWGLYLVVIVTETKQFVILQMDWAQYSILCVDKMLFHSRWMIFHTVRYWFYNYRISVGFLLLFLFFTVIVISVILLLCICKSN